MQVYVTDILLVSSLKGRESYVLVNFAGSDFKYPYALIPFISISYNYNYL